jgi:hypothetical protein
MKTTRKANDRKQAHWRKHIEQWQGSSLTQAEYCRRNNLKTRTFTYWKRRLKAATNEIRFVPVPIEPPRLEKPNPRIKISVNDHYRIEVPDGFNPDTLEQILRVLEVR